MAGAGRMREAPPRDHQESASVSTIIHHVSRDADEIRYVARGWDVDFRPLESAPGDSELVQMADPELVLSWAHLAPRVAQRGASPGRMRTFALLARGAPEIQWCGLPVRAHSLMCFSSGGEFDSSSPAGFEVHTLSIDVDRLDSIAGDLGVGPVDDLGSEPRTVELSPARSARLRRSLERATRSVVAGPEAVDSRKWRSRLESEVGAEMLRAASQRPRVPEASTAGMRQRALRRALEYIDAFASRAPKVDELCRAAGCSERTLRYAFQEQLGVAPKAYLQAVRLYGVRRELREYGERTSVSDAANHWGFWHMGQLAADYRRLFGELPSDTLARNR